MRFLTSEAAATIAMALLFGVLMGSAAWWIQTMTEAAQGAAENRRRAEACECVR